MPTPPIRDILESFNTAIAKRREHRNVPLATRKLNERSKKDNPLIEAVECGDINEVTRLIKSGIDLDEMSGVNKTALKTAARYGHFEIVKLLIEAGASVDYASKSGGTPLMLAAGHGHFKIASLLIEAGADVEAVHVKRGKPNQTALSLARAYGHQNIVRLILETKKPSPRRRGFDHRGSSSLVDRSP